MGHCAEKGWKIGLLLFTHLVLGAELVIEELGYDGGLADPGAAHDEHPVLGLVPPGPRPRAPWEHDSCDSLYDSLVTAYLGPPPRCPRCPRCPLCSTSV